ncbi:hypothetical protein QWY85_19400 [Neolewinella lacunae]|uniref:Secreted protein n=1 Tax=Neolewinella lacunae TaxID=1517758 RepID=A0A923PHD3_9BACT|nr:hypothetical protein [Neolewinella lacunae]MBC6993314.1 hypothetical protein [Neolewinella lacunae]MDN3636845.1 hypothetical protein [Neolewinella lacunae]
MKLLALVLLLLPILHCSSPVSAVSPYAGTSKVSSSPTSYQLIKKADCFSSGLGEEVFKVLEKPPTINLSRSYFEARIQNALTSSLTGSENVQLKIVTVFFSNATTCLYQLYATDTLDEKVIAALELTMNEKLSIRPGTQGTRQVNSTGETYVEIVRGAVNSFRHHNYGFTAGR